MLWALPLLMTMSLMETKAQDTVLQSDALTLTLRSAPAVHVAGLTHRASGVNLAVDSAPVPLFSLSLGPEGPDAITLTSLEAKRSGVSVESVPEGRRA
ncbi:hypothetical protein LLH03_01200, partial [bacterium]|nr:hypothetical protein [bacterium]